MRTSTTIGQDIDDNNSERVAYRILYQPFSLLLMAAVSGILFDKFISVGLLFWLILAMISIFHAVIFHIKSWQFFSTIFVLLFCFSVFGFWHNERWNKFAENDLGFYAVKEGYPVGVRAIVSELPRLVPPLPDNLFSNENRTIFTIQAKKLRDGKDWKNVSGNVFVTINGDRTDLMVGNEIQIFGELSQPIRQQNPDDTDFAGKLRSQRILSVIHGNSPDSVTLISSGKISVAKILGIIRHAANKNLSTAMSPEMATLASAMLLGLREGVDEQTRQNLIDTGTMHILAISGLHVAVVAICFKFLFVIFGLSNRITAVVMVLIIVQYLLLTNMAPPAIRATALITVISIAEFTGRRAYGINSFCATAIFTLILNPTELFQFGAQLSYIATAAFFWLPRTGEFVGLFKKWILRNDNNSHISELSLIEQTNRDNSILYNLSIKIFRGGWELFIISVVIWSVSTPLILDRIHVFAPIAILVNMLLCFPLYAAMLSGFITMIVGSIPFVGMFFGMLADFSFDTLFGMIAFFQWLGGHYWVTSFPVWWSVIFYASFIFVTIMPFRCPSRLALGLIVFAWICVGVCSFWVSDFYRYYSDKLTMEVFAVGHGNCVLLTTPSKKMIVYDVGCITSSRRVADILSRAVWRKGKMKIDTIIISHPDRDHFNGLEKIIERFDVDAVLVSPYMFLKPTDKKNNQNYEMTLKLKEQLQKYKIPIIEISKNNNLSKYNLPNSIIQHPPKTGLENANTNSTSLVLQFRHCGVSVLLPADLDNKPNIPFLDQQLDHCDIMMIPHHGGKSDVTELLIEKTTPQLLIISDGGFTHRSISVDNYRKRNFLVHSTHDNGYIKITINKNNWYTTPNNTGAGMGGRLRP
ncbi:MAG: ComEC/Rec2 family competence protein [Planctomycetaceae bacterium]|nr:ComEC/Rec2 family competence protein [Planctomycetaceae bacterium]